VERIIVVGPPGSGKSTLARSLAAALDCPHVELDALYWQAGWTESEADAFGARAVAALGTGRWVADGNYFSHGSREAVWPRADTIVWLDLPRRTTFRRVVVRTTDRSLRRTELWNGNRESLRLALARDGLIPFAWRQHPSYGERYGRLMDDPGSDPALAHLRWIRLRSPRAIRRWMATMTGPAPA
jgi:shikimate kinase